MVYNTKNKYSKKVSNFIYLLGDVKVIIVVTKLIQFILKKLGRGSSLPGKIALKLDKHILNKFKLPKTTIFITGTVGKTTTCAALSEVIKNAGYKVGTNSKGSNLSFGVVSTLLENSTITGKSNVDVLVIEIDERYVKKVLPYITPNYFIINNLSRDQLSRNGHCELVFQDIDNAINENIHLILNSDNLLSRKFAYNKNNKVTYFGVAKNEYSSLDYKDKIDIAYCPNCKNKINYTYFNYGNFGSYNCTHCNFQRETPDYEAQFENGKMLIDNNTINILNNSLSNVYNYTAVYTVAKLLGIENRIIVDTLNDLDLSVKRFEKFSIGKNQGYILVSKNETPISYNQSLHFVSNIKEEKVIAIGFSRISGRYDDKDISWLYDIDFSLLNKSNASKIILFGKYCYDLAVRLKLDNIDMEKVEMVYDCNEVYNTLKQLNKEIYCIFYFDLEKLLKKQLLENGEKIW